MSGCWLYSATAAYPLEELGWQDPLHVDPNGMMSVVTNFDQTGGYVWHCRILSHEDNGMMRPYRVVDLGLSA